MNGKTLSCKSPYLKELIVYFWPRALYSGNNGLLVVPRIYRTWQNFWFQAPLLWNQLPVWVQDAETVSLEDKSSLKVVTLPFCALKDFICSFCFFLTYLFLLRFYLYGFHIISHYLFLYCLFFYIFDLKSCTKHSKFKWVENSFVQRCFDSGMYVFPDINCALQICWASSHKILY